MGAHYSDTPNRCVDNFVVRHVPAVFVLSLTLLWQARLGAEQRSIGLSSKGAKIEAFFVDGQTGDSPVVVLVGGLNGPGASSRAVQAEVTRYEAIAENRRVFKLIAIPAADRKS